MSTNETNSQNSSTNAKENDGKSTAETRSADFHIERGNAEHLTEFQRAKAKYFFRVNLDMENKEHIKWGDVDFYIQFHITAAGKDGTSGGDIEPRLERAARALWEHIHDEIPLPDKNRDTLTLEQALDTWSSLVDYIIQNKRLPSVIEDLVKLGFELYSTEGQTSIQPIAFDQLFRQMELGRPYAIMAFKFLSENGNSPLTYEKIEKIVQDVITSSDDEHPSHFLLPGFFKTITKKSRSSSSASETETSPKTKENKSSTPPSPKPAATPEREKSPSRHSSPSPVPSPKPTKTEEKPPSLSPSHSTPRSPSPPATPKVQPPAPAPTPAPRTISPKQTTKEHIVSPMPQNTAATLREEDENIRNLLRFYHIDDGDIVEVASGSVQRVVLVHPERPLPAYIQQNKELLQKIYPNNGPASVQEPKPKPQEPNVTSNGQQRRSEQPKKEIPDGTEEKIVSHVLKELAPFIEKRVSDELNRLREGKGTAEEDDDDDDDDGFMPFPFMFAGPPPFFGGRSGPFNDQQQGGPGAASFIPPPLLMAMMNDLARSAAGPTNPGENQPGSASPRGPGGPTGVEGFMMFVNGEPMMPGGPRF